MKRTSHESGFALAITLVLMALIVIIVVAYLASTRIERSTSSVYASRSRAKLTADSGLAAAIHLLKDNTRYGNYITAMPAPSPSPAPRYTEIYRPQEPSTVPSPYSPDYVRTDNAVGDVLVSRAGPIPSGSPPQIDPRPTPQPVPSPPSTFAINDPGLTNSDSYDFNQIVRVGSNSSGRLIQPSPSPSPPAAFGQWVRVRNAAGDLIGRYAFFIEDESMKINVNFAGNNVGGSNLRVNDLTLPAVTPAPATQIQELDPSGVLSTTANRNNGDIILAGLGTGGSRLPTRSTLGLLTEWQNNFPDYVHMTTVFSRDDVTTARGWQRLDLNALVAGAADNTAKAAVANRIANWIRDAWTSQTPLGSLQPFQVFGDDRLLAQIAANIVDYIDVDSIPTDMGDVSGDPVIGIEKIPYLVELDVVYTATANPDVPGQATIGMSFRLNFFNMFETDLRLGDYIGKIRIKGVPVIIKNGAAIFQHDTDDPPFEIVVGGGASKDIADTVVPWGGDNVASGVAGVKTFQTGQVLSQQVTYTTGGSISRFEAGLITVDVLGKNGERLDSTKISLRDLPATDSSSSSSIARDFLQNRTSAASINSTYGAIVSADGSINTIDFGDPRYRPQVVTKRWYNLTRTDTARFATTNDKAEMDVRTYAVDWYDYVGNRPLLFHRNGPMASVGELGNVSVCEYPWRTIYLQYAGRLENTSDADIGPAIQDRRGSSAAAQTNSTLLPQDYALIDLFKTSAENTRDGSLNINSQFNINNAAGSFDQGAFTALFAGIPAGGGVPAGTTAAPLTTTAATTVSTIAANRRSAVAPAVSGGPGAVGGPPPIDNGPRGPYFTIGQMASDISWLINQSEKSTTTSGPPSRSRSTVNYSVLRSNPTTKSQYTRNFGSDMQVEEPFRKISNAITTRGNVFRVLYVGQAIKDINRNGQVDSQSEISAEYLGEAFLERQPVFQPEESNPDATKTSDSTYKVLANRVITE